MEKYSDEWYAHLAKLYRELFCNYISVDPSTQLTKKDINDHRYGAFNKICWEMGCNEEFLEEALLNESMNKTEGDK